MPPKLRAVAADEKPPQVKPKTLAEAIEGQDYLAILEAQRRDMIADVATEKGPAKAALHRLIALHSKEIAALQAKAKQEAAEDGQAAPDEPFDAEAL